MMMPEEYDAALSQSRQEDVDMEEKKDNFKDVTKDLIRKPISGKKAQEK